jgi:uncharacterized protein involved in oxidation of intracellular sulfur
MTYLFIFNDSPHATQRTYNGLRLALSLAKQKGTTVHVFLIGEAVVCGLTGFRPLQNFYNLEDMFKALLSMGGKIRLCHTCLEARGIQRDPLMEDAGVSSLDDLTAWTQEADKVLVF